MAAQLACVYSCVHLCIYTYVSVCACACTCSGQPMCSCWQPGRTLTEGLLPWPTPSSNHPSVLSPISVFLRVPWLPPGQASRPHSPQGTGSPLGHFLTALHPCESPEEAGPELTPLSRAFLSAHLPHLTVASTRRCPSAAREQKSADRGGGQQTLCHPHLGPQAARCWEQWASPRPHCLSHCPESRLPGGPPQGGPAGLVVFWAAWTPTPHPSARIPVQWRP